jgi:hypothetical protein
MNERTLSSAHLSNPRRMGLSGSGVRAFDLAFDLVAFALAFESLARDWTTATAAITVVPSGGVTVAVAFGVGVGVAISILDEDGDDSFSVWSSGEESSPSVVCI